MVSVSRDEWRRLLPCEFETLDVFRQCRFFTPVVRVSAPVPVDPCPHCPRVTVVRGDSRVSLRRDLHLGYVRKARVSIPPRGLGRSLSRIYVGLRTGRVTVAPSGCRPPSCRPPRLRGGGSTICVGTKNPEVRLKVYGTVDHESCREVPSSTSTPPPPVPCPSNRSIVPVSGSVT